MKFTAIAATAAAALVSVFPTAAFAGNSFQDHIRLTNAIAATGVDLYINPPSVCDDAVAGMYISGQSALVVCQENATGAEQVDWTDEDLNTLRHEAQHLIQDCVAFRRGDQTLSPMMGSDEEVIEFAIGILGRDKMEWIASVYAERGADWRTIVLEFEAWAVGDGVDASVIESAVRHYCL